MKRFTAFDWLLIGISLPILLLGVALSVVHGVRGDFVFPPFLVSSAPAPDAPPVVRQVFPSPSEPVTSLTVGDKIWRLDGADLRGVSTAGVALRWSAVARTGARTLLLTREHGGERSEVQVPLVPGSIFPSVPWWVPLWVAIACGVTAVLLLVRAPHWRLVRRGYLTCAIMAFAFTPYFCVPIMPRTAIMTLVVALPLNAGLVLWTTCELIPGARLWGPLQAVLTCVFALILSASFAAIFWLPDSGLGAVLIRSGDWVAIAFFIAILAALTLGYWRSDPLGRRQIKWIVYGFYVGCLPMVVFYTVYSFGVWREWVSVVAAVSMMALVACPFGLLIAIAFYHFLDIDRLFGATLAYSLLAIVGLAIMLGVMPSAGRAFSDALGLDPTSGQLVLSVGLATVLVPSQRVVRPRIDQLLFPERVTLQRGFQQLLADLSRSAGMQDLALLVVDRLDALLRPSAAILYVRSGDVFTPLVVRGRAAPPAFAAGSSLIATLQESTAPFAADRWRERRTTSLTPFERAALETLDVAVLMPIRRGTDLIGFSCLGPKRSGDIYTATDLALLGAVTATLSDRLLAVDAAAVAEQARAMQGALRRFVPSAVAERIVSGQDLSAGEREVTVLFVDIRGYTGFSEPRAAQEIFRTVNRYTEAVSAIVQARGGVVVEFHGDGMLAVFGAPEMLPMKERAAVEAAREIVNAVAELSASRDGDGARLSVGVGIATGAAFVGNIESADRAIWTALGNPVNLAARLQSMTRELEAAVAIDDLTFRRAGPTCTDFVCYSDRVIRGRTATETVHALPLSA